jgi:hypothetical protein
MIRFVDGDVVASQMTDLNKECARLGAALAEAKASAERAEADLVRLRAELAETRTAVVTEYLDRHYPRWVRAL